MRMVQPRRPTGGAWRCMPRQVPFIFTSAAGTSCRSTTAASTRASRVIDVRHEQIGGARGRRLGARHRAAGRRDRHGRARADRRASPASPARMARQHPDGHHRRAGAARRSQDMGVAAGHEPRRADAADHQVVGRRCPKARRLGEYVSMAFRVATTGRARAGVPRDADRPALRHRTRRARSSVPTQLPHRGRHRPAIPRYIEQAFELLRGAQRPVCLVGTPAAAGRGGARRIRSSSQTFGMPIYVNGLARGSLPTRRSALLLADPQGRAASRPTSC